MDRPMDQIINWFMLLIIFVFDPLAIGMVVAANMAFSKSKPKVEGSLPEGAEWGVSYSLKENNYFDPNDVDELKHWEEELEKDDNLEITDEDEDRMNIIGQNGNDGLHYEENKKNEVVKKEYVKLPKTLKNSLKNTIKHARRQGIKIPDIDDRFFED